MESFPIIDISDQEIDIYEQLGTKEKFWFKDQSKGKELYLFKATYSSDKAGERIERHGEDWAEKIACELAKLIGLPTADYELALYDDRKGVICRTVLEDEDSLIHGNQLLLEFSGEKELARKRLHTLDNVITILDNVVQRKPKGWNSITGVKTASDVFIGYLMLDTIIGNQDRHEDNWGVVQTSDGTYHLAPTYDHAASLGRNESDEKREQKLQSKDIGQQVSTYVTKAKSLMYNENGSRIKTIDLFQEARDLKPAAARTWLQRLDSLDENTVKNIIDRIPSKRMSKIAKNFSIQVVIENVKRLQKIKERYE